MRARISFAIEIFEKISINILQVIKKNLNYQNYNFFFNFQYNVDGIELNVWSYLRGHDQAVPEETHIGSWSESHYEIHRDYNWSNMRCSGIPRRKAQWSHSGS